MKFFKVISDAYMQVMKRLLLPLLAYELVIIGFSWDSWKLRSLTYPGIAEAMAIASYLFIISLSCNELM